MVGIVGYIRTIEISTRLGNDVDMPRNLEKSLTVEWSAWRSSSVFCFQRRCDSVN